MKVVVNRCWGGYGFSYEFLEKFPTAEEEERTSAKLIAALEEFGLEQASCSYSELEIVEIPDGVTDWLIQETDGSESIIYVLNGKLRLA